jgi:predicted NBD/HSP70 family sugar kinase
VSSVVADLLAEGLLVESGRPAARSAPGPGRPATTLLVNPAAGVLAGVHLRHDGVRIAMTDLAGGPLGQRVDAFDVDRHTQEAIGHVAHHLPALMGRAGVEPDRLRGVGVAISAPVPTPTAVPGLLPMWRGTDVARDLSVALGVPVHLGNDADLGAMAESMNGAGRDVEDFVYVMLADGVGCGLILGGRLHHGGHGAAGELGHVVVDPEGAPCRCGGRGCLETVVGADALVATLRGSHGEELTLRDIVVRTRDGEPIAAGLVDAAARAVGRALAGVCAVIDPQLIVVGGPLAAVGESLLRAVRDELIRLLPPALGTLLRVEGGRLGDRAEVLGAAALAGRHVALI